MLRWSHSSCPAGRGSSAATASSPHVTLRSLAGLAVWRRDSDRGSRHGALVYPALLAIALGFKESAAILPFQMALVAWGWPGPRPRGMLFGVVAAFAVLGLYFVFRSMLFSSMFETYIGTASRTGSMIDRLSAMLQTIPAWWDGFAHARPRHGAVHVAALAAALLAAAAFCRGGALRLAIALLAASGGLAAATFYHLGGMAPTGEGGRLLYGPIAWLALALGVLLLHAPGARLPLRVARALAVLAIVAGAGLLHVMR